MQTPVRGIPVFHPSAKRNTGGLKMNFYFVDDDKNVRNILKILVTDRQLGKCCGSSGNGYDALEDVEALHPDIILVDLLMPDMDGISFVEK